MNAQTYNMPAVVLNQEQLVRIKQRIAANGDGLQQTCEDIIRETVQSRYGHELDLKLKNNELLAQNQVLTEEVNELKQTVTVLTKLAQQWEKFHDECTQGLNQWVKQNEMKLASSSSTST